MGPGNEARGLAALIEVYVWPSTQGSLFEVVHEVFLRTVYTADSAVLAIGDLSICHVGYTYRLLRKSTTCLKSATVYSLFMSARTVSDPHWTGR